MIHTRQTKRCVSCLAFVRLFVNCTVPDWTHCAARTRAPLLRVLVRLELHELVLNQTQPDQKDKFTSTALIIELSSAQSPKILSGVMWLFKCLSTINRLIVFSGSAGNASNFSIFILITSPFCAHKYDRNLPGQSRRMKFWAFKWRARVQCLRLEVFSDSGSVVELHLWVYSVRSRITHRLSLKTVGRLIDYVRKWSLVSQMAAIGKEMSHFCLLFESGGHFFFAQAVYFDFLLELHVYSLGVWWIRH